MVWLLVVPAYFLGTFPSAVMVARAKGVDIYSVGSGNPGASNVARAVGTKWGLLVFLLDGLKGAIPAAVGLALDDRKLAYALLAAAVLGHMFPATRKFKGGKGVATMAGGAIVLWPVVAAVLAFVWYPVRKLTGKASLATFALAIGYPIGVWIAGAAGWEILAVLGLEVVVLAKHTDNIKRLIAGTELSGSHGTA
jgi:glycerol-3-phosphate acyltransferase PlsY